MSANRSIVIVWICFAACIDSNPRNVSIGRYSLEIPKGWYFEKYQGPHGDYGEIQVSDSVSIFFSYRGYFSFMPPENIIKYYNVKIDTLPPGFERVLVYPKLDTGEIFFQIRNMEVKNNSGDYFQVVDNLYLTVPNNNAKLRDEFIAVVQGIKSDL